MVHTQTRSVKGMEEVIHPTENTPDFPKLVDIRKTIFVIY